MELKLIDTGYLNIEKNGSQLSASERAGYDGTSSVSTFDIPNVISLAMNADVNTANDPVIGTNDNAPIRVGDYENDKYTVVFAISRDYNPSGFHINYLKQITRLSKTKSVKAIYPSGDGSFNSLLNYLAQEYNGGAFCDGTLVPADTNYLPIIISKVSIRDDPTKKYITLNLTFEITK